MIDRQALLSDLRGQLRLLERDLAERADSVPEIAAALEAEYRAARDAERTAATFGVWRAGELTQAAVAWLLACVFVRFIEDNGLIEEPLIGGPNRANDHAADRQTIYFRARPTDTDRDYLLEGFAAVACLPAMAPLYDRERNPVWRLGISGDAARDLLAFWRATDPDTGVLGHDFTDPEWDTRFLGDLYQDLSDDAKKRYALLQTPEFVEEFILDRTLTSALDEFGLADTRLIDPACGSGHFLLGAFRRLLRQWSDREPCAPKRALAQRALDAVYGVDVNRSLRRSPASGCWWRRCGPAASRACRTPPRSGSTWLPATVCCTAAASVSSTWAPARSSTRSPAGPSSRTPSGARTSKL